MAIDTRAKRGSAICVSMPWRPFLPLPDGAISQGDRQSVPFLYSGILAGGAAPVDATPHFTYFLADMGRMMGR